MKLKELRKQNNETQEYVASLIGVTRGAYANIENGKREPDFSALFVLADHYGVTIDELLDYKRNPSFKIAGDNLYPITEDEYRIILAYRKALPADIQIIDNIVNRYVTESKEKIG